MDVEINVIGILGATVAAMIIGGLWYSPVLFGKSWMELSKIDESKMKDDQVKAMGGMLVLSLLMAYVLAHVAYLSDTFYTDVSYLGSAITTGFWVWLGFVLPTMASNSLFNQQPWKLTAIHLSNWLITLLAMGAIIGLVGLN